jgi:hypothetical protein
MTRAEALEVLIEAASNWASEIDTYILPAEQDAAEAERYASAIDDINEAIRLMEED